MFNSGIIECKEIQVLVIHLGSLIYKCPSNFQEDQKL